MVGMRLRDLLRRIAALSVQLCHGEAFRGDRRSVSACMDASLASPWRTAFSAILTAAGFYGPFIHLQQRLPTCPRFFSSTAPTIFSAPFTAFPTFARVRASRRGPSGAFWACSARSGRLPSPITPSSSSTRRGRTSATRCSPSTRATVRRCPTTCACRSNRFTAF